MKIEQKPEYQPITITLESVEEAIRVWDAISEKAERMPDSEDRDFYNQMSNWFSNHVQLGG